MFKKDATRVQILLDNNNLSHNKLNKTTKMIESDIEQEDDSNTNKPRKVNKLPSPDKLLIIYKDLALSRYTHREVASIRRISGNTVIFIDKRFQIRKYKDKRNMKNEVIFMLLTGNYTVSEICGAVPCTRTYFHIIYKQYKKQFYGTELLTAKELQSIRE